ncbi:dephospho-CoA kinase [Jeotgalibaca sp. PTS2502]|uniref:dephospho-CoA kinase n=1 Tax=Jeotgalibaca sp. PTS2502 TaxID=1903686 RepID=UPI000973ACE6|nr:dephospho-CoA kinase [Jeotgalibaca sp. PTS2502]APZ49160.1 dephospho-CoA kinase [Jeotgalibaca sp. PTS2502]
MFVLGLTGCIATGKSTVSRYLASKGIAIVDADLGARQVVEIGSPGLQAIADYFGPDVLLEDGSLNRKKLGSLIFSDSEKRAALDGLLDGYIRQWMRDQIDFHRQNGVDLLVLDIPLLFEAGYAPLCDAIMVVYTPKELQCQRLMQRDDLTKAQAIDRMNSQLSIEIKKEKADIVIDNSGNLAETYLQVDQWLAKRSVEN